MARMLQALKNLEAKEARPQPNRAPAAPAVAPVVAKPVSVTPSVAVSPSTAAVAPRIIEVVDKLDAFVDHELARGSAAAPLSPFMSTPAFAFAGFPAVALPAEDASPVPTLTVTTPVQPEAPATPPVAAAKPAVPTKTPCELERQVKRTLNNPIRSQPLVDLVDRLLRDMAPTERKVLAFFGLGISSELHLPILQAATVLAEKRSKNVLLVDGDLARRGLSDGLEYGRCPGVSELIAGKAEVASVCQATATRQLSFVPAGQMQAGSDSTAEGALKKAVEQLKVDFDCILIDAGNAGSDVASAEFISTEFISTLARASDAAYLVVELGVVETNTAQAALARLRTAGARVLGCIAT